MNEEPWAVCARWARGLGAGGLSILLGAVLVFQAQALNAQQHAALEKLTLAQIESLVLHGVPDSSMASQVERRGIAFAPTPTTLAELRAKGAGPLTIKAVEQRIRKPAEIAPPAGDLLYIPSALGLVEVSPGEPLARRIARTSLCCNDYVVWNSALSEFYVVPHNTDAVSVIAAGTFTEVAALHGSDCENTYAVGLSPNGDRLLQICDSGNGNTLRMVSYDTSSRTQVGAFPIHGHAFAVSPKRDRMYVAGDSTLAEYDRTASLLRRVPLAGLYPLVVSPDGQFLFALQQNKIVRIVADTFAIDKSLTLPEAVSDLPGTLFFSRDGQSLFTSGRHAIYRIPLSLDTFTALRPPHEVGRRFEFTESGDGRDLYVLGDYQAGIVWMIDPSTGQLLKTLGGIQSPETLICVPGKTSNSPSQAEKEADSSPAKRVSLSAARAESMLIVRNLPVYPPIAKAAKISGTVVLRATVSATGSVEQLEVVSGPPLLQQSALDAVRQWRYQPFLLDNKPIGFETTVNLIYTLPQ